MAVTTKNFDKALQKSYDTLSREGQVSETLGGMLQGVYEASADIVESLQDGFQLRDILELGAMVPSVMTLVDNLGVMTDEEKKKLLRDIVLTVYVAIDRGEDGAQNNINIPFAFGPVERKVELEVINLVCGALFTALSTERATVKAPPAVIEPELGQN